MAHQLRAHGDGQDAQPAGGVEPGKRLPGGQGQDGDHGGAHAVAEGGVNARAHALPGLAAGQGVDAGQGAAGHGQKVSQQGIRRGAHIESRDGHDAAEGDAQPGQHRPPVPDSPEQLEDGDPAGLQADQRRGRSHGGQLQGADEAGEVQRQRDGGRQRPAELPAGDARELAGLPDQDGPGHDGSSDRIAPEGDGQGTDGCRAQGGGDERAGGSHAQDPQGGKEEVHAPTVMGRSRCRRRCR